MSYIKFVNLFFICLLCLSMAANMMWGGRKEDIQNEAYKDEVTVKTVLENESVQNLLVPSVQNVRKYGYPKNENGETYGPDVKELDYEPDLILLQYNGIYGYIRKDEFDDKIRSPKEAIEKTERRKTIKIYLHDGITCIGTLEL